MKSLEHWSRFKNDANVVDRKAINVESFMVKGLRSRPSISNGVEFLCYPFHGYGGQIRVSPKGLKKF